MVIRIGVKKDYYDPKKGKEFFLDVTSKAVDKNLKIYWKESVRLLLDDDLLLSKQPMCVGSDYDIFGRM